MSASYSEVFSMLTKIWIWFELLTWKNNVSFGCQKPECDENGLIHHMHFVISNLPISNERLEQFKETWKDPILQTLIKYTIEGWTEKTLISQELHPCFTHHSDISYHEGLLLKDQQIVVTSALRSEMKSIYYTKDI